VRQRRGESREHRLRPTAKDIGERRTDAPIRDMRHVGQARFDLELFHREMRERPGARGAIGEFLRIRFRPRDELAQVRRWHGRRDDQHVRRAANHRNRREVLDGVVRQLAHGRIGSVRSDVPHHQRVTIGRGARGRERADDAAAALVFDDDGLSQRCREPLGNRARHEIDAAARLHRRDDPERFARPCLLRHSMRSEGEKPNGDRMDNAVATDKSHHEDTPNRWKPGARAHVTGVRVHGGGHRD
jgi:hypothetical protein